MTLFVKSHHYELGNPLCTPLVVVTFSNILLGLNRYGDRSPGWVSLHQNPVMVCQFRDLSDNDGVGRGVL